MHRRLSLLWVGLAVGVAGCAAKKAPPPPLRTVTLGDMKAEYRDWSRANVCDVDPSALQNELESMRMLLAEFLGQTSAGFDGMWGDEHLALLEQAEKGLPPALDGTAVAVEKAPSCPGFDSLTGVTPGVEELVKQARKRIAEAPYLIPYVKARREQQLWRDAQPKAQADAKAAGCAGAKKSKTPVIYYAAEKRFLFCDGTAVTLKGEKPTVEQKKKFPEAAYLDAANKYPREQIASPPPLPPKGAASSEQDTFDLNQDVQ